jgi:hypothetical protein
MFIAGSVFGGYPSLTGLGSRRQVHERCETGSEKRDLVAEINLSRPSKTKKAACRRERHDRE